MPFSVAGTFCFVTLATAAMASSPEAPATHLLRHEERHSVPIVSVPGVPFPISHEHLMRTEDRTRIAAHGSVPHGGHLLRSERNESAVQKPARAPHTGHLMRSERPNASMSIPVATPKGGGYLLRREPRNAPAMAPSSKGQRRLMRSERQEQAGPYLEQTQTAASSIQWRGFMMMIVGAMMLWSFASLAHRLIQRTTIALGSTSGDIEKQMEGPEAEEAPLFLSMLLWSKPKKNA